MITMECSLVHKESCRCLLDESLATSKPKLLLIVLGIELHRQAMHHVSVVNIGQRVSFGKEWV